MCEIRSKNSNNQLNINGLIQFNKLQKKVQKASYAVRSLQLPALRMATDTGPRLMPRRRMSEQPARNQEPQCDSRGNAQIPVSS